MKKERFSLLKINDKSITKGRDNTNAAKNEKTKTNGFFEQAIKKKHIDS